MRPRYLGKRVDSVDVDLQLARGDEIEELIAVLFEILPASNVVVDHGPHQANVLGSQSENVQWGHGTGLEDVRTSN